MKKLFRTVIPVLARLIPTPRFSEVTYYRHRDGKYLYYCMSEDHIKDDEISTAIKKILELFPKAIRISQMEFDIIHYFHPDIEVVEIADDKILAELEDDGSYADDDHEETEDKDLINEEEK